MKGKYRVRVTVAHTVHVPADQLTDGNGHTLAEVPAYSFSYVVGHEAGFSTKKARADFLKANPKFWEIVS